MKNYIVTGLGRCGTSMVMRMLHAGGMGVYCDDGNIGTSFETSDMERLPKEDGWLYGAQGKAFKLLDMHRNRLPRWGDYKIIILVRDPTEQAKSQIKLITALLGESIQPDRKTIRSMAESIRKDMMKCSRICDHNGWYTLVLEFEEIILNPYGNAMQIADFLPEVNLDVKKMSDTVVKRTTSCYDGLLETRFL